MSKYVHNFLRKFLSKHFVRNVGIFHNVVQQSNANADFVRSFARLSGTDEKYTADRLYLLARDAPRKLFS